MSSNANDQWNAIQEQFLQWSGMRLPLTMRQTAFERLTRLAANDSCDIETYLQRANNNQERRQNLLDELGLGMTWFMRDEAGLRTLIQALVRSVSRSSTIWLWSAGCSSGEEAYSLAMTLADEGLKTRILGTDLNRLALARARDGLYTKRTLRNVPKSWFWRYFDEENGLYRVKPEIRRSVSFELHNLTDGRFPPTGWFRFDAIVCRNVLIYFDTEAALQIIQHMATACRPNGYLLLGAIERTLFWMSNLVDRDQAAELVQVVANSHSAGVKTRFRPVVELRKHVPKAHFSSATLRPPSEEETSNDTAVLLDRAEFERKSNQIDEALRLIDIALTNEPLSAPAHLARGLVLKQANRTHEAIECLRASRFLDDQTWLAPYQLALCLSAIGSNNDALEAYRHALAVLDAKGTSGLHRPSEDVDILAGTAAEVCRDRINATDH